MKKIVMMAVVLHCLFAMVFVSHSMADIYKYVDKNGNICFADNLQVVPEQYRASALIVQEESTDEPAKARTPAAADSQHGKAISTTEESQQKRTTLSFSYRLTISGCIIIGSILAFYIARNQPALKKNEKLTSIIRNSLVAVLSLYLVIAHAKDAFTIVGMAGNALDDVQRQSAEKGRKVSRGMKALDTLFEKAQKTEEEQN